MNFLLSYNWLKEYVDVDWSPEELADELSLRSASVERFWRMDRDLDRIIVGRVSCIEAHPKADKLRLASVSDGKVEYQVVCGGENLREGMLVAYAMPGARVRWHGEGELVELKPTVIRGVESAGMICAASEIGLGEWIQEGEHDIADLSFLDADAVGKPLGEALGFDDTVFDIEVTTNRPDMMCVLGFAREVAAITGKEVRSTAAITQAPQRKTQTTKASATSIEVSVEDAERCPLYSATMLDGVSVQSSPWWMQQRLIASGVRPICNVVDVTNYVLLEMGQPLHAFDTQKLSPSSRGGVASESASGVGGGVSIIVRNAKKKETIDALDGAAHALDPSMLVIA
ncbi:MAG: phenylalanine--tRNA ligase beta subunit-related protein, partial [Candidatus Uhrbacteria bacterium]